MTKITDEIQKRCVDLQITPSELCVKANVHPSLFSRWKENTPSSIRSWMRMKSKLDELEQLKTKKNG